MLKLLDKAYHNIWFNTGCVIAASLMSLWDSHIGWGLALLYFIGAAFLDMARRAGKLNVK